MSFDAHEITVVEQNLVSQQVKKYLVTLLVQRGVIAAAQARSAWYAWARKRLKQHKSQSLRPWPLSLPTNLVRGPNADREAIRYAN